MNYTEAVLRRAAFFAWEKQMSDYPEGSMLWKLEQHEARLSDLLRQLEDNSLLQLVHTLMQRVESQEQETARIRELFAKRLADQDDVIEAQANAIMDLAKEIGALKARIEALEGKPEPEVEEPPPEILAELQEDETFSELRIRLNKELTGLYGKQDYDRSLSLEDRDRMQWLESQVWLKMGT